MSDDEGFTNDINSEMVQVNFIPLFPPKKYKSKLYLNQLKLQLEKLSIQESIFIDQTLQNGLSNKFANNYKEKIIFCQTKKTRDNGNHSMSFQSSFEGGNLEYVVEESKHFHLYIRSDSNTSAHHQWFYFIVKNRSVKHTKLTIHNFAKPNMLYLRGLKPYYKSLKENKLNYEQIQNNVRYQQEQTEQGYLKYQLTFQLNFKHAFDEIQMCCQPPYTFHKLNSLIFSLPFKNIQLSRSVLGQKVRALLVNENKTTKATVVVIARQHPGEAVGSWMMEGFINKLQHVQSNIFWIIIPMVNVDGVKMGNNRTGILGHDFNRNWNVDEESLRYHMFPEIMGILKYFKRCKKQKCKRVKMFIDLHGHSSQPNVFAYGPPLFQESYYYQNSRLFPYMLSQANQNFNLHQCSYDLDNSKKNCARSVFFNRLGFPYSYTIESSFGIYSQRNINELDMMKMGQDICQTTLQFIDLLLFRKNEQRLKEMISDVRKSGLGTYNQYHNDSESDYDQGEPKRIEFQKKVTSMLIDPQLQKQEIKRLHEQKTNITKKEREIPRLNLNVQIPPPRQRTKVDRIRTEGFKRDIVKSERQTKQRRSSLFLPAINGLQLLQPPKRRQSDPKRIPKNFSLTQITQRLQTMKHNKIGRRILILNDYPTSPV